MFLMSSDMEPSGLRMNSRALSSRYTFTGTLISTPPALRRLCFSIRRLSLIHILEYRLKNEYNVDIRMQNLPYSFIRWIENEDCDPKALNLTSDTRRVEDFKGRKLLLFTNAWSITWAEEHNKERCV